MSIDDDIYDFYDCLKTTEQKDLFEPIMDYVKKLEIQVYKMSRENSALKEAIKIVREDE